MLGGEQSRQHVNIAMVEKDAARFGEAHPVDEARMVVRVGKHHVTLLKERGKHADVCEIAGTEIEGRVGFLEACKSPFEIREGLAMPPKQA